MIYVDKTAIIAKIASQRTPIFFSRPRRFGKTLLITTMKSLFSKGLEDFHGLAIESMWSDTIYNVVHLDFSGLAEKNPDEFNFALGETILQEFHMDGTVSLFNGGRIRSCDRVLNEIAKKLEDNSTVLLIDEYDAPLTHHINEKNVLSDLIKILSDFYATIKQYTDKFRYIFITGITRTSHVSIFSSFNNLKDISFRSEYNALLGFTKEDLKQYFSCYVKNAASILEIPEDEVYARVEQYYDGYQFSLDAHETIYNPWSILSFFDSPELGFCNYWFESGGMSSLIVNYIKTTETFNLLNYNDRNIYIDTKRLENKYEISNIPIEILLYQAGYFTIRKETNKIARLVFPNTEVEDSILDLYLYVNNIESTIETQHQLDDLANNIDEKNLDAIVDTFNAILNECVSIQGKIFDDERSVRDIIYAALPQNRFLQKFKECETVKGRSDLELFTTKTHMVIEFKRTYPNRDASVSLYEAIEQIKSRKYGISAFKNYSLYRVVMVIITEDKMIDKNFCKEI